MAPASFKPIYVVCGPDAFLRDRARRRVIAGIIGDADPQTCVSSFDGMVELELADVMDELRTPPLLSSARVVVVRDADTFVSNYRKQLEKYLSSPSGTGVLLLIVRSFPAATKLAKAAGKIGKIISCSGPEKGNLSKWLVEAAARRQKEIAPQARELLGTWMGRDLAALDAEIEKLSLYVGERETITVEDVGAVVTATAGPVAFGMVNAIRAGDRAGALKELGKALRVRGDEFAALGLLAWHVRQCLQVQEAVAAGRRPALGKTPPRVVSNLVAMIRRRGRRKLQADMRSLIDADLGMKSGRAPRGALQELVIALCS